MDLTTNTCITDPCDHNRLLVHHEMTVIIGYYCANFKFKPNILSRCKKKRQKMNQLKSHSKQLLNVVRQCQI